MKGRVQLKDIWKDPNMKELIDSLWREYPGLYNEKYDRDPEKWLLNILGQDVEFGQAMGQEHSINGNESTAIGIGAITRAFRELVLGSYATDASIANPTEWDEIDRLITVGNGLDENHRSDALILFKSGLLELLNAVKIGKFKHGDELPTDGVIQYLQKKLELYFDNEWHELALKSDLADSSFTVNQPSHGFALGNTIKITDSGWVKTSGDNSVNSGTTGLVSQVIDANTFKYITGGLLAGDYAPGAEYFLSNTMAGGLMILADPEVWEINNVREFIGTGVEGGLMVEIDSGEIINPDIFDDKFVTQLTFDTNTRKLTAFRSAGLPALEVTIPVGISLINPNWNETDPASKAFIIGKPNLAPVATSGKYSDLTGNPTIAKKFTDLDDVIPDNYIGKKQNVPMVTDQEDKMDLCETEELETDLAKLLLMADCPQTYSGCGGYVLRVKLDETGIEFVAP